MEDPIYGNHLYMSKMLRKPREVMRSLVYDGQADESDVKYMIYSGHDWQISQALIFFNSTNDGNYTYIPFDATYIIELHSSTGCTD